MPVRFPGPRAHNQSFETGYSVLDDRSVPEGRLPGVLAGSCLPIEEGAMSLRARLSVGLLVFLITSSAVQAALLRYDFTAQASWVDAWGGGLFWPSLLVGGDTERTITGHFVVDTTLGSSSQSGPWYASGYDSIVDFQLRSPMLNGYRFAAPNASFSVSVDALGASSGWDELYLEAPLTGPGQYAFASLHIFDFAGTGLNMLYQTGAIDLTPFDLRQIAIGVYGTDLLEHRTVRAELTSLTGTALSVPEASTLLLLGPAVAGLLAWRRPRRLKVRRPDRPA